MTTLPSIVGVLYFFFILYVDGILNTSQTTRKVPNVWPLIFNPSSIYTTIVALQLLWIGI